MKIFSNKKTSSETNFKELRVKEYLKRYMEELQRHFDVSDRQMRTIVYKVYKDLSPFQFIKNWVYMVKSNYIKKYKLRGRNGN